MNSQSTFGERLKRARIEAGFATQADLAKKIGVTTQTVNYYEQDKRKPDCEMFGKIALVLDVSCEYLLGMAPTKKLEYDPAFFELGLSLESQLTLYQYVKEKSEGRKGRVHRIDIVNYLLNGFAFGTTTKDNWRQYNSTFIDYLFGYLRSSRLEDNEHFYVYNERIISFNEYEGLKQEEKEKAHFLPLEYAFKYKYYNHLTDALADMWKKYAEYQVFNEDEFWSINEETEEIAYQARRSDGYDDE